MGEDALDWNDSRTSAFLWTAAVEIRGADIALWPELAGHRPPRPMFAVACARRAVSTLTSQSILRKADIRQRQGGRSTPWFSGSALHLSPSQVRGHFPL